ncbi:MAG: pyridoxamine 5'-phosphate oxidase [Flavobacteriaceae bacterium]|nr:pyridoxamine 5'-phosphate oxidase [Flavobacteriaceae bacterium]
MSQKLHDYRKSYQKGTLTEQQAAVNPIEQFALWFQEVAQAGGVDEVNAMTLSTVDAAGYPRGRVVLLKHFDARGFQFFTNYSSQKGRAIAANPKVSLSFFWPNLERQVHIRGSAEKLTKEESQAYFSQRPKGSQIGAIVSPQSEVIADRASLEQTLLRLEKQYQTADVPIPDHWGGYLVQPIEFEFWQGRENRLHDRLRYRNVAQNWTIERLAP